MRNQGTGKVNTYFKNSLLHWFYLHCERKLLYIVLPLELVQLCQLDSTDLKIIVNKDLATIIDGVLGCESFVCLFSLVVASVSPPSSLMIVSPSFVYWQSFYT